MSTVAAPPCTQNDVCEFRCLICGCISFLCAEVRLGFEEIIYTAAEPVVATFTQVVCMRVTSGGVGRELIIVPDIIQGTAQSECDFQLQ